MRIAYFDEAGVANEIQEPYLVVGGVLIHGDTQWNPIEAHAHAIVRTHVPAALREDFSFHAMHLFGGSKKYNGIPAEARFQILREVLGIIKKFELPVSYGAVTRSELTKMLNQRKVGERLNIAHQLAFSLCLMGFQGWFNRECGDEVAICVASRTEQKHLRSYLKQGYSILRKAGVPGQPLVSLFNFVDALHFAAPEESVGLQLGRLCGVRY